MVKTCGRLVDSLTLQKADISTHKFQALAGTWDLESKVIGKKKNPNSVTFTYSDRAALELVHNNGNSILFNLICADYKALSEGAILVYRRKNELWKPEPNPVYESGNNITISKIPPEFPNEGDVWVDEETYYIYIWDGEMWVALTGPEGGTGGGDISHNKEITMISSRGLMYDNNQTNVSFRLNQLHDQQIDVLQKNLTSLSYNPPSAPEEGDIWISTQDYRQYVYNGDYWIGVMMGDDSYDMTPGTRLDQPCRLIGG